MRNLSVINFRHGIIDQVEPQSIKDGAASASLNWLTSGDKIELRGGYLRLGADDGVGATTGLHVGRKADGTEVLFKTYKRKIKYFDAATKLFVENGTDVLPAAADGEEISFSDYHSLAGAQVFLSSPNSSLYKIMTANPGSISDVYSTTKGLKGLIKIKQNRTFLWNTKEDKTGLNLSFVDNRNKTTVVGENVGTGNGVLKTFPETLNFRASNAKATCYGVAVAGPTSALTNITAITQATNAVITSANHGLAVGDTVTITGVLGMTQINNRFATVTVVSSTSVFAMNIDSSGFGVYTSGGTAGKSELFTDNYNGVFTGNQGGTGTINYTTGAISVTFNIAPINGQPILSDYQHEDSTNKGIADFSASTPRKKGEGDVIRQDDGGGQFQNIFSFEFDEFCMHIYKTWKVTLTEDDTVKTNQIFRDKVGIPNWRAAVSTGDGIYYIDDIDKTETQFRILRLGEAVAEIIPFSISQDNINLKDYLFDKGAAIEFGDILLFACRHKDSTINNRVFLYNKLWRSFDLLDYYVSNLVVYNGTVVAGDPLTNNVYELFSGFDDDGSLIENFWEGNISRLGVDQLKKVKRLVLEGDIGPEQKIDVYLNLDRSGYTLAGTIEGSGTYVDKSQSVTVGSTLVGSTIVGAGTDGVEAYHYTAELKIRTDKFYEAKVKFVATAIGYASVSKLMYKDIRPKSFKIPSKYRS